MAAGTGRLLVSRPAGGYRDRIRAYKLVVDGTVRGKIKAGGHLVIEIPAGRHRVQAIVDWNGSQELELAVPEGSEIRLRVEPGGNTFQIYQIASKYGYLKLDVEQSN